MKYLVKFNENDEWQNRKDESDFQVRMELIGCDYDIGFSFGNTDVPSKDINSCIEHYNKLDKSWIGGPVSDNFINWFSFKYGKPTDTLRKAYKPIVKLILHTDTSGDLILGFGIKSKKISTMNCKDISTVYQNESVSIEEWTKHHIFDKRLTFDETIKLLNIKTDFNWQCI